MTLVHQVDITTRLGSQNVRHAKRVDLWSYHMQLQGKK